MFKRFLGIALSFLFLLCRGYSTSLVVESSNLLFYSGTCFVKCQRKAVIGLAPIHIQCGGVRWEFEGDCTHAL